ncbi:hypothetical protein [Streptacidiphilus rugosus]|uniref:hypothetical protein n=1 Tax=Streptacidiphilus rugosus TaxID=405783 RepID=UPI00055A21C9|nr:hypothetical protein [Streptacidiphilus rugosus]
MIFRNSALATAAMLLCAGALSACSAAAGATHPGPARTATPVFSPSTAPTPTASATPTASPDASASPSLTRRPAGTATHRRTQTPRPDPHTMAPRTPGPGEVSTPPQNGDCKKIPSGAWVCGTTKTGIPIPRPSGT